MFVRAGHELSLVFVGNVDCAKRVEEATMSYVDGDEDTTASRCWKMLNYTKSMTETTIDAMSMTMT